MASGIYQISCQANGKVYIGSALVLSRRKAQHFNKLRSGVHSNSHLQNAWKKYGESALHFSVLRECPREDLERMEDEAMRAVPVSQLFNVRLAVETNRGIKWTAESRKRIAGRKFSELAKARRREVDAAKRMARLALKSQPKPRKKRRPMTQEERLAARSVLSNYWHCPNRIAKSAAARTGQRRSERTRARISVANSIRRYGIGIGQLSLW